jgi:hypothetical protein
MDTAVPLCSLSRDVCFDEAGVPEMSPPPQRFPFMLSSLPGMSPERREKVAAQLVAGVAESRQRGR